MSRRDKPASAPVITARQLTKIYPQPQGLWRMFGHRPTCAAVDRVDLEVGPGQVFGLLGLNGAGKTTLVRMFCGLLLPTSGAATVLGHDVRRAGRSIRATVGLASGE
ncbi:MAG TPA: ATP-binding cassette domain-containing protein, partial [Roseiflexaceae bacterium]